MKQYLTPSYLALAASSVITVGLSTGKGLLSVCTVALAFAALWRWVAEGKPAVRQRETRTMLWMTGIFFVALISGFWTENDSRWAQDLYEKIPLLLIPPAIWLLPRFSKAEWIWIRLIFVATQTVVAAITLIRFAFTYSEQMERVAQNAYIDIAGSISHIYFGLLLGWSVLVGIQLWLEVRKSWKPWLHAGLLALTVFNLLAVHVLVSRTGLLGCYAGLAAFGAVMLVKHQKQWLLGALLALLVLGPVVAYYTIPSFQVRVKVTIWDAEQYYYEADLTDNSLSLRLLAWEASWGIVQEHPWIGVGMEDVGREMLVQYDKRGLSDKGDNLLTNPHNQYLKQWAGAGLAGLLVLVMALVQPLWDSRGQIPPILLAFVAMMAVAMCFESLLERQIGMTMFALFGMWLLQEE